ncbi:MAG: TatD family hydrolase, partial [Candidatus Peribacteraceae bacterium]|nr:TatD family hydrolase [Candidatus Peribacteraceae bacterium]
IADTLEEGKECLVMAEKYDQIFCTMGVHPHAADKWKVESGKRIITEAAQHPKMVAVGEVGLDYHYMNSPKKDQIRAFRDQIEIAKELDFPLVVHNRDSIDDLLEILRDLQPPKMVLHCCTEKWEDVSALIDRGYLLGFTGIATYAKSEAIRETIKNCPLEQMMVETDAPYLAPEGYRGKRCEPAYVVEVAKLIAQIKGISLEEVDRITTSNTEEFYGLSIAK